MNEVNFTYYWTTTDYFWASSSSSKIDSPLSSNTCILGSNGIFAISSHPKSSHICLAPPDVGLNIAVSHLQLGHTNPLMFSTTPKIGTPVFLQKLSSFLTSAKATSWGVVTTIAPSHGLHWMYWTRLMCSSDVPGGAKLMIIYYRLLNSLVHPSLLLVETVLLVHFYEGLAKLLHHLDYWSRIQSTWLQDRRDKLVTIQMHFDALIAQLDLIESVHWVHIYQHPTIRLHAFEKDSLQAE